jgi:hypothetical protein
MYANHASTHSLMCAWLQTLHGNTHARSRVGEQAREARLRGGAVFAAHTTAAANLLQGPTPMADAPEASKVTAQTNALYIYTSEVYYFIYLKYTYFYIFPLRLLGEFAMVTSRQIMVPE